MPSIWEQLFRAAAIAMVWAIAGFVVFITTSVDLSLLSIVLTGMILVTALLIMRMLMVHNAPEYNQQYGGVLREQHQQWQPALSDEKSKRSPRNRLMQTVSLLSDEEAEEVLYLLRQWMLDQPSPQQEAVDLEQLLQTPRRKRTL